MKPPAVVDFETEPIGPRPAYPPRPVSVAVWERGEPEWWGWGHPEGNNCTEEQARRRLRDLWRRASGSLLFHEAPFDLDVAETHLGLPLPPWHRVHCTVRLLFLADPNAEALALKPAAERYLGWPQEDQEPLRRWILSHVPEARRRPSRWEAWISRLPGDLAAARAIGDVRRTRALFELCHEEARGEAYDRERRLIPVLLGAERRGVPVDVRGLSHDAQDGRRQLEALDRWLRRRLRAPDLEVDSREQLADALEEARLVDEWILTAKGSRMTAGEALREVCKDRAVVDVLRYRGILRAQVATFAEPWLAQARETGGRVYVQFNAVRSASAWRRKQVGARTGRLSSHPNLMNVSERQPVLVRKESALARAEKRAEALLVPVRGTRVLDIRSRVRAPRGQLLGDHDFNQQEMRLGAHCAGRGPLFEAFRADPRTDSHTFVESQVVPAIGRAFIRRDIKAVNFGVTYGEGIALLAYKLHCEPAVASRLRLLCKRATGFDALDRQLKLQGYCDTLGGRHCPVEPPSVVNGQLRTWEYKLLNTLIQGSAADQIKEAMIQVDEAYPGILLLSVHDELLWMAAARVARTLVAPICTIMEYALPLDVPVLAEGKVGRTWRDCH